MLKSELAQKLAEKNPHLYHQDLERVVNIVLNEIIGTLKDDGRVELRASAHSRQSHETGEWVAILEPVRLLSWSPNSHPIFGQAGICSNA